MLITDLLTTSKLTQVTVLVLERGGSSSKYSNIPYIHHELEIDPLTKIYKSIPPKSGACLGVACLLEVGNGLGGGTMYDQMVYTRGSKFDYDTWSEMGAKGWSYDEVVLLFKDIETIDDTIPKSKFRGTRGPVHLSTQSNDYNFQHLTNRWLSAATELGYPVGDYNTEKQVVFAEIQRYIRNGVRENMGDIFLGRYKKSRTNIDYRMLANVTKVLMRGRKAIGVEYLDGISHQTRQVYARKEVLLAAGALETPRLLMVSGIGPKDQLEQANIPVISHLPGVGRHLQDHPFTVILFSTNISTINPVIEQNEANYCKYLKTGTGVFSSTSVFAMAFLATSVSKTPDDAQVQMYLNFTPRISGLRAIFGAVNPRSRGTVTLNQADPSGDAIVDTNYLHKGVDKANMLEAIQVILKVMKTKPFRQINATLYNSNESLCSNYEFASSKYWSCFVQKSTINYGRFSGTCRMGAQDDPRAVVDPRLRVRTVRRLRVVDSSVMPTVIRGNSGVAALLIGWKGALMIKHDHRL